MRLRAGSRPWFLVAFATLWAGAAAASPARIERARPARPPLRERVERGFTDYLRNAAERERPRFPLYGSDTAESKARYFLRSLAERIGEYRKETRREFRLGSQSRRQNRTRALTGIGASYERLLGQGFLDALAALGPSDRWVDVGAGEGLAIREYLDKTDRGFGRGKARVLAVDPFASENLEALSRRRSELAIEHRMVRSRRFSEKSQLMSDVVASLSYDPKVDRVLARMGQGLAEGGKLFFAIPTERLPQIVRPDGSEVGFRDWLDRVGGLRVVEQHTETIAVDGRRGPVDVPYERFVLERTAAALRVPALHLVYYSGGGDVPERVYLELARGR